eukprot:6207008-Pleurochrysis_carterae.AAC.1
MARVGIKFSRRTVKVAFGVKNSERSLRHKSRCAKYRSCWTEGSARSWALCSGLRVCMRRSVAYAWSAAGRR